ncbi:MAG: serine hydrolase domain-containing protein [Paraglaciecola sp.]|uniref:serine hydrolase domain-containing protein n=1 Tax=Paraglaciecola sp. TaxID=1920173 RepID=UPI0032982EF6
MKVSANIKTFAISIGMLAVLGCDKPAPQQIKTNQTKSQPESQLLKTGLTERIRIKDQTPWLQTLEQRQKHYNVPGVSLAFMRNGRVVWTLQSGVKDLTTNHPLDENTVFQAGSISKPAFGAVLMKYRQENALDLDADVNKLLTSWQLPQHDWSGQEVVSLRRLLSHTAGTTVHGFPGYAANEVVPTLIQVLNGAEPANTAPVRVDIRPGSKMRYSGGGTTLAQLVLQDVTGEILPTMAERLLFAPLGMKRSSFEQPISSKLVDNRATPYKGDGTAVPDGAHTYATLAAAGMWSTPTDMLNMASAVRSAYLGTETDWISQATAVEILTSNAPTPDSPNVGIGFFINMSDEGEMLGFGHGGADEGFMSQLYLELNSGNGYAIMTNGNNGNQLISELEVRIKEAFDIGYAEPETKTIVELSTNELTEYLGSYAVTKPVVVDIVLEAAENGFLLTASPYVENEKHWYQGKDTFFAMDGSTVTFERDKSGAITDLSFNNGVRGTKKR